MVESAAPTYAGFWIRLAATIADTFILLAFTAPILYLIYGEAYLAENAPPVLGYIDIFISWVLPIVATLLFWRYRAGTPGKLIFHLAVVDASSGQKLTALQSLIRYFAYIISALPFGIGFFWVIWDRKKQAWHDKLAKSVVIKNN
ncbi:RDD family protein [Oceanicoccus sp. KOV_DT_Chl]|uniref:RDD family protein n=1 Tax=Oceanicoccus sp. KOV_DT_Chl TaxID=1904639 RepID=UPI000C7B3E64|nr:RDD family protein [Oceanicoccus sp. KOV_DT_Chl]